MNSVYSCDIVSSSLSCNDVSLSVYWRHHPCGLIVEYIGDGLMKGSKFTGQVGKYYRSSVKRSKGIIVDQGGELMVEITWRDAPSQFAKSCVGKADNFKVDDFLVDYKVRKKKRIAISNNVAVAAISNSTSSSGKK